MEEERKKAEAEVSELKAQISELKAQIPSLVSEVGVRAVEEFKTSSEMEDLQV